MKRILSTVLSLIIAIGTLPAAYASGLSINKWNGFTGAGVTVTNPDPAADSDDDVIKFESGESATLSLTNPVSSNMLVSFDFYAESEQDSEISVLAADDAVMGKFSLASDGTAGDEAYETGKWQTAKILVFPEGKIYRIYLNDVYAGEGEIDTASLYCEQIKFEAGGVLYINNIDVSEYALPLWADSMLKTVYKNDSAVTVDAANPLFTEISVANAIIEANIDATAIDGGSISITLAADNGEDVKVLDLSGAAVPEGEFAVKVNVSADSQTADVYVDDTKVSNQPISLLATDKTPATEITEITLEVAGEGSVSVKSLYVKEQSEVKNPAGDTKVVLFEETFNDRTVGSPVPYFEGHVTTKLETSFTTVDATTGHASSPVGMLHYPHYNSKYGAAYRFNDDGTPKTTSTGFESGTNASWYYTDISTKTADIDNITLSFKYYNAMNVMQNEDRSGLIRDRLYAGFSTGTGSGDLNSTSQSSIAYYINNGEQYVHLRENGSSKLKSSVVRSSFGAQWVEAKLTIKTTADNTVTATVAGPKTDGTIGEESVTLDAFPEIKNLVFEQDVTWGGKFYLDDIEVSTIVTRDEDEYYTEAELMDISAAVTDSVYTNDITRVETDVEEPDMPEGTVTETIENYKTTHYSNDFSTMGIYGFEESENLEASAVYADNMGSVMSLTQKEAGSAAKAIYKIGSITDTWDGTVDTSWYDASADSYEIWSGADLAGLRKLVNESNTDFTGKTVKLMANIDLDNKNWTPIGTGIDSNGFKGTFDGNGHEIRNLSIRENVKASESNTRYFGLFGKADGRMANLGINGAKVIIASDTIKPMHLAALVANFTGTMESCYVIDAEIKEVRSEEVEKQIKRISDGGTWTYNRDQVAVLIAILGASSTVNGCYTRDVNIYASWHSISSPFIGMSNGGSASTVCYVKNSYAAAPFTYATNPATGERGRVYTMIAKSSTSYTIGSNNYITHSVEEFRGPGNGADIPVGETTKDIYGNGFATLDATNGEIATVLAGALLTSLESTNLYAEDIANINAGHPILKSQRIPVDADEMNVAFEAMVPDGSDADLVLYSGNEVAKTISLTDITGGEWKTIDLAFRNGTYIPTIDGVEGSPVEFESANDGISEFAFVVNDGTAYIENLMIYKDSAELLKKKINKIMADIYSQVPEYPVLNESLTLPETVDGYSVTWKSSNKSYVTDKGEILARKDCTMPISLTATITLDPVNADYAPADAEVTFNFMLAPSENADDEKIVDGIIADIINGTYITEEEHNAITKDLNTLPTEWDGATITWEATGDAMDNEGKITIPETDNADVTLSATVVLGDVEKTETLSFTILSYENILKNASDAITYELINGEDGNMVKKNLNFPETGLYDTEIEWSSDRTDLITDRGFLMEINDEEYVTITVTVTKDGRSTTKEIPFVTYISPTVKIAADMAKVTVPEETSENMELDTVGDIYGATITWASNSTYAEVNGARINVTRPEYVVGDTEVTLTATFEIDGVTVSTDYTIVIKCLPSNEDLIRAELDKIDFTDISDEPETAVQGNLHLVYDFPYSITPTWSSDSDFVTNDGIVTRPAIGEPNEAVTMTLKLERGGVELSKEIPFTVKAYGTTQEILDYAKAQLNFRVLSDDPINLVVDDLVLPKEWKFGTEISWTSDSNLIKVEEGSDGNYKGAVTLAEFGTTNTPVKLTATISYEGQTVTKDFYVTVGEHHGYEPLINTDFEMLTRGVNYAADRNNLGGGQYEHNNLYQITVPEADPVNGDNTALKIYKTSDMPHLDGGNSWAFFRTVAAQRRAGIIRIEQDIYLESMPNLTYKIVGSVGGGNDGNYEEVNISINKDGEIYQWKTDYTASKKLEFGKWNTLAIEFSTYEKWIDIYLNGELVLDNAPFQWNKDGTNISALKIKLNTGADKVTTANDTHILYIDDLKVLRKVDYSGEMSAAAKDLEVGFLAAQNINEITSDIVIPDLSKYELTVSGTSSNTNVITNDGTVTRPAKDTEVEYTVKLSSEFGGVRERTFKLLVKADGYVPGESGGTVTDAEKAIKDAEAAIEALKNSYTINYITSDITLPTESVNGSTITWKSMNTDIVSDSGAVTRPSADTTVTLIATATLNGVSDRKEVQVTVKAGASTSTPVIIPGAGAGTTGGNSGGGLSGVMPYEPPKTTETQTPSEIPTTSVGFVDIENHWAKDYITELHKAGVINGVSETEFAPNDSISREAFLTMLIRALGNELSDDYGEVFDDVKTSDWYYQYVMEGYRMGIVNGTSMTEFGTGTNISRQDLCTMIARALESKGIEMDAETASEFADNILIEIYARDAVYGLQNLGIVNGKDNNNFDPRGYATRAEAAKIMAGLMDVLAETE